MKCKVIECSNEAEMMGYCENCYTCVKRQAERLLIKNGLEKMKMTSKILGVREVSSILKRAEKKYKKQLRLSKKTNTKDTKLEGENR